MDILRNIIPKRERKLCIIVRIPFILWFIRIIVKHYYLFPSENSHVAYGALMKYLTETIFLEHVSGVIFSRYFTYHAEAQSY